MKATGYLLVFCAAVHVALGLRVTLSEPGASVSGSIFLLDSPRTIPLVLEKTYKITCEGDWYRNNMRVPSNAPDDGSSGVYVEEMSNEEFLHLQLLSEPHTGQYVCRAIEDTEFILTITTGNPVLIPSREVLGVRGGFRGAGPSPTIFGSGIPQPTIHNYSWYFNDEPLFLNGEEVGMNQQYVTVEYNNVILRSTIEASIGGVYRSVVRTSAGEVNVTIVLNVEFKPDPVLSILLPTDYSENYTANGESVVFNCSDTVAVPPPSFNWTIDGVSEQGREGVSITRLNTESYLNISAVNEAFNGSEVKCVSSNVVEDELSRTEKTINLIVWAPPPPPTNLTVQPISSCLVWLSWDPPPDTLPPYTLQPEYFLIEAQVGGGDWGSVDGDPDDTILMVYISDSGGVRNVLYNFRISSVNERGGASTIATQASEPVQLYFDELPTVSSVSASPASPTSISLTWVNPSSDCYQFTSHNVSCKSPDADTPSSVSGLDGEATSVTVTKLAADTVFTCVVLSTVSDAGGGEFPMMSSSLTADGFTYPNYPEAPMQPRPVDVEPSSTNITVFFFFPTDQNSISHYQVVVVRLRSEADLPDGHPHDLYPPGYQFSEASAVNDPKNDPKFELYIAAEIDAASFSPTFIMGSGSESTGLDSTYKNAPLLEGKSYSCFLRAFPKSSVLLARGRRQVTGGEELRQYAIFSSTTFMEVQKTAGGSSDNFFSDIERLTPWIAAASVIVVLLIVVVVMLFIIVCYCKQKGKRRKFDINSQEEPSSSYSSSKGSLNNPELATPDLCRKAPMMEMKQLDLSGLISSEDEDLIPSGAIPVDMFSEHMEKFNENCRLLFQREFDWIQINAPNSPAEASNLDINDDKNRYSNIVAFDHSRVVLSAVDGVEGSDYINANYIPGYKRTKEYISTQGPLDQTVVDFWRMVWEQNTATIVMLTNLVEQGKVKCAQYWPSPAVGTITCGDIEITLDDVAQLRDYTVRNFTIRHIKINESHAVLQFHYTKWPDYGTPKLAAPLLNFLRAVHTSNPPEAGPIVVHCSAGVGRSGTVITIDYCLAQLKADHVVDVRGFVSRMREHRNHMVQTEVQYSFIHYAVLEAITYGDTSFPLSEFSHSFQHLQQKNKETGLSLLEEEHKRLGKVKTMAKMSSFIQRVKQKGPTNRSIHYPGHASYSEGGSPHEYHAHYIDAYFTPKLFIVADGPTEDNVTKFWQMIWDQDCSDLIMLTPLDADYYSYWPGKGEQETYGNICVAVEEEIAEHYYTTRVISISNAKIGISQKVTQYQFVGWTSQFLPPVPTFVSFMCEVLNKVETLKKNQKALIHDVKSLGPSGIFCSLCFCIERLRVERMVDVFQAVQSMQLQHPGSVQSMQEYAFVYDCVYEFIRTHSAS